jgi:hypothetical protein
MWYPSTTPPTSGGGSLTTRFEVQARKRCLLFPRIAEDTVGSDISRGVMTHRGILARGEGGHCVVPVYLVTLSLAVSGCLNLRVP